MFRSAAIMLGACLTAKSPRWFLGLLIAGGLAVAAPARAGINTTAVAGTMGKTVQTCPQLLTFTVGESENCLYNGGSVVNVPGISPGLYPPGESTGPFSYGQYYDSTATPQAFAVNYAATPGDGKINQVIAGTVTVDDSGTVSALDDQISFSLTLRSPGSGDVIRNLGISNNTATEKYTTMTQMLTPHAVNFAIANGQGGFDYIIGSAGFPTRLSFTDSHASESNPGAGDGPCVGQLFGDMECGATFHSPFILDPLRWTPWAKGSGLPGLSSMEGNLGARTLGTVTGYQCIEPSASNACQISKVSFSPLVIGPNQTPGGGVTAEDVGWDNLLLQVSTDATGQVTSLAGYDVQEYQVFGQQAACGSDPGATQSCNSWLAGYFSASVVPVPPAAFLFPSALAALGWVRRRRTA